jgi:hypothetical protein
MKTRVRMLKVKIKSLAEEARIIRLEEARSEPGSQQQIELHAHRVHDVRREQRASLLAYAFLRGVPLAAVEAKADPDEPEWLREARWKRVGQLVEKFGTVDRTAARNEQVVQLGQWITAGKANVGAA